MCEDDLRLLHLNSIWFSLHLPLQNHINWTFGGHVSSVSLILLSWHILAMQFKSYTVIIMTFQQMGWHPRGCVIDHLQLWIACLCDLHGSLSCGSMWIMSTTYGRSGGSEEPVVRTVCFSASFFLAKSSANCFTMCPTIFVPRYDMKSSEPEKLKFPKEITCWWLNQPIWNIIVY